MPAKHKPEATIDVKQKAAATEKKRTLKKYNIDVENLIKLPGRVNVYWKDEQFNYLGCNDVMAELLSYPTRNYIVGTNDYDFPINSSPSLYQVADAITMKSGTTKQFYDAVSTAEREIIQLTIKSPLRDRNDKIIGIFGISYFLTEQIRQRKHRLKKTLEPAFNQDYYSSARKYLFEHLLKKLNISRRQGECLYYLVRGMTLKRIGRKLNLSPRTVESYLEILADKFDCSGKSELIAKAIELGFESFLLEI